MYEVHAHVGGCKRHNTYVGVRGQFNGIDYLSVGSRDQSHACKSSAFTCRATSLDAGGGGGDFPTELGSWALTMGTIPHDVVLG